MMVEEIVELYREGAITGYQAMLDCLHMLDPQRPELVLASVTEEIRDEMVSYAARYDAARMVSQSGKPPTVEQVTAAARWIFEERQQQAERIRTRSA